MDETTWDENLTFNNMIMRAYREFVANDMAKVIASIQPMTGPSDLTFGLKLKWQKTQTKGKS